MRIRNTDLGNLLSLTPSACPITELLWGKIGKDKRLYLLLCLMTMEKPHGQDYQDCILE